MQASQGHLWQPMGTLAYLLTLLETDIPLQGHPQTASLQAVQAMSCMTMSVTAKQMWRSHLRSAVRQLIPVLPGATIP